MNRHSIFPACSRSSVPPLLDIRNLTIEFATAQGLVSAVRDVSFHIDPGEVFGLVGESGSGKSVTSLAVLRLLPPQARIHGAINFRGEDMLPLAPEAMRHIRGAGISMIFQEPMTALNPVMRVGDQIAEAVLASFRERQWPHQQIRGLEPRRGSDAHRSNRRLRPPGT